MVWGVRERQPGLKARAFVYDLGPIEAEVQAARLLHESCFTDFFYFIAAGWGTYRPGGRGGEGEGKARNDGKNAKAGHTLIIVISNI